MSPKIPYYEQLRMPDWLRKRAEIIELHHSICFWCKEPTPKLTIHHRYYISGRMAWEYHNSALVPVCDSPCHQEIQKVDADCIRLWEQYAMQVESLKVPNESLEIAVLVDAILVRLIHREDFPAVKEFLQKMREVCK